MLIKFIVDGITSKIDFRKSDLKIGMVLVLECGVRYMLIDDQGYELVGFIDGKSRDAYLGEWNDDLTFNYWDERTGIRHAEYDVLEVIDYSGEFLAMIESTRNL